LDHSNQYLGIINPWVPDERNRRYEVFLDYHASVSAGHMGRDKTDDQVKKVFLLERHVPRHCGICAQVSICPLLGCFDWIAKVNIDPRLLSWMAALGTKT
jgi:hypothetical protein